MDHPGWRCFLDLCLSTRDENMLSELFDLLLTPEERDALTARCLIIRELLLHQKTQRQISKDLNVSIAKITRGSNELKRISAGLRGYLMQHLVE